MAIMGFDSYNELVDFVKVWLATSGIAWALKILMVLVLLLVGGAVIRWVVALAEKALLKACKGKRLVAGLVASVISKVLWAVLLVIALSCLGINIIAILVPLVAGLSVAGFVVGFACQDSLANLAAGVMIALNEPFEVGDAVTVAGITGVIHEVSMMATVVKDGEGNRVVVPNKAAWGGVITNRTKKF